MFDLSGHVRTEETRPCSVLYIDPINSLTHITGTSPTHVATITHINIKKPHIKCSQHTHVATGITGNSLTLVATRITGSPLKCSY